MENTGHHSEEGVLADNSTVPYQKEYYYSLSPDKGFTVFVWKDVASEYRCGIMEGNDRLAMNQESLLQMALRQGISVEDMKEVLAFYHLSEDRISVEPYSNSVSDYAIITPLPYEEYRDTLRKMFFE